VCDGGVNGHHCWWWWWWKGQGLFFWENGAGWFFLGEWGGVLRRRLAGGGVVGNGVDDEQFGWVGVVWFFCWQDIPSIFRQKGMFSNNLIWLRYKLLCQIGTGWW
jgi:hypothetical protein